MSDTFLLFIYVNKRETINHPITTLRHANIFETKSTSWLTTTSTTVPSLTENMANKNADPILKITAKTYVNQCFLIILLIINLL